LLPRLGGNGSKAGERPNVNPRVLGKSKTVRVANRITTFCTGNNLRLTGDMPRRALLCSLDARIERPEVREFKSDPVERVLADRGKYIAAALTVVRSRHGAIFSKAVGATVSNRIRVGFRS